MNREEIKKQCSICSKCGKCRTVCPTFVEERKEALSTRGRIHLTNDYANKTCKASEPLIKSVSTCLFCLKCKSVCPNNVDIEKVIIPARSEILDTNGRSFIESFIMKYIVGRRRPLSIAASLMGISDRAISLAHMQTIYRSLLNTTMGVDKTRLMPKFSIRHFYGGKKASVTAPGNTKTVIYFPGCSANLVLTNIAESALALLLRSGTDVLLPRMNCCGMPVYASGDLDLAAKLARQNIEKLRATGARTIVTTCGSCGSMLGRIYKDLLGSDADDFEVIDIMSYLIREGLEPGSHSLNLNVTYHDPCHLKRGMNVYEEPRQLLSNMPGVNFIEMEDADTCCGSGGTVTLKYYDLSKRIRKNKIHRFQRTKAHVLATGCPACVMNLEDGMAEYGLETKVLHPIELLNLTFER
ncbi:MAG: (Fe-S)-binding protein [Fibrobacteres bacterium]|nr:(Fe-S)-binding protein [Fibrobacterota bacterium]